MERFCSLIEHRRMGTLPCVPSRIISRNAITCLLASLLKRQSVAMSSSALFVCRFLDELPQEHRRCPPRYRLPFAPARSVHYSRRLSCPKHAIPVCHPAISISIVQRPPGFHIPVPHRRQRETCFSIMGTTSHALIRLEIKIAL